MDRNSLPDFLTTTANSIDGYDVVQTYGVVRGIVVRSRSMFGSLGAVFQTIRGGNISILRGALRANACRRLLARDGARTRARGECDGRHSLRCDGDHAGRLGSVVLRHGGEDRAAAAPAELSVRG